MSSPGSWSSRARATVSPPKPESKTPMGASVVVTCTDFRPAADWLPIEGGRTMTPEPIDATRLTLRALRLLDDGRRAVEKQWQEWTAPEKKAAEPPADRRQPPEIW